MADFLSDMNALTQSVGNAANSISHLYQVRTDLESKRIASQIQKENYNFIMRTKLPLEDPNRIDLDNWRPELEAHNSRNQELVDSTRWDSVKGAVSQSVEPISQRFSLEVADAYAGQEIQKAQIDGQISLENNLSTADTPEKMEAFIKDFDDYQNAYGLYPPDVYQKNIIPIYDNARAGLLFNKAVTDTKSTLVDSSPDPSDPYSERGQADLVSATETISSSTSNPRVKAQAMARLQAYSKQQTEAFSAELKQTLTDNKENGNVPVDHVLGLIANAGFVDKNVLEGAKLELQGYVFGQNEMFGNSLSSDLYAIHDPQERSDASVAGVKILEAFGKENPDWLATTKGMAAYESKMQELAAMFVKPEGTGSAADLVNNQLSLLHGDLIAIMAESESTGTGSDKTRLIDMTVLYSRARQITEDAIKQGINVSGQFNAFANTYGSSVKTVADNMKAGIGASSEGMDAYTTSLSVAFSGLKGSQLDYYRKQIKLPASQRDMDFNVANDAIERQASAMLVNTENMTAEQKQKAVLSMQFTIASHFNDIFKKPITEEARRRIFSSEQSEIADAFLELDSGALVSSVFDTRKREYVKTPYISNIIEQGSKLGASELLKQFSGSSVSVMIDPLNGDVSYKVKGKTKSDDKVFLLNGENDNGTSRLILVNAQDNSKIYLDQKDSPEIRTEKKAKTDEAASSGARKGYELIDKYRPAPGMTTRGY